MEDRVARLEGEMQEVKSVLSRLEPMIVRIDVTLTATLPNLATKAELTSMRSELSKEISDLRTEVSKDVSDLRTDAACLRAEVTAEISGLRGDMNSEISGLRGEMITGLANLRTEMIARFADVPTKTYLWGILGVLITAYGSGLAALAVLK